MVIVTRYYIIECVCLNLIESTYTYSNYFKFSAIVYRQCNKGGGDLPTTKFKEQ